MLDHERELIAKIERLLRQSEESLAHCRAIIAEIDNVRSNRSARLASQARRTSA
jgi:hypothetical protein